MKSSIAFGTTHKGLGELAWSRIGRFAAGFRHARARRKAYQALAALDDRTLRDIGIDRREIWRAVDEVLGEKPSAEHSRGPDRSIAA